MSVDLVTGTCKALLPASVLLNPVRLSLPVSPTKTPFSRLCSPSSRATAMSFPSFSCPISRRFLCLVISSLQDCMNVYRLLCITKRFRLVSVCRGYILRNWDLTSGTESSSILLSTSPPQRHTLALCTGNKQTKRPEMIILLFCVCNL